MKMLDRELEEIVYSVLRRCPEGNDYAAAKKIVSAIIEVEVMELKELTVSKPLHHSTGAK